METVILAFILMLAIVAAMAVGVAFGRKPIKGSCGGISQLGLGECEICGAKPGSCLDEMSDVQAFDQSPNAVVSSAQAKPDSKNLFIDATLPKH